LTAAAIIGSDNLGCMVHMPTFVLVLEAMTAAVQYYSCVFILTCLRQGLFLGGAHWSCYNSNACVALPAAAAIIRISTYNTVRISLL